MLALDAKIEQITEADQGALQKPQDQEDKAVEKAYQEYDIFNKTQPIESDFDKIVKGLKKKI